MKIIFNWKTVILTILLITFVVPGFSQVNTDDKSKKEDSSIVKTEKDTEIDSDIKIEEINQKNEKAVSKGSNLFSTVKQGGLLMIALLILALGAMTIIIERLIFFTRNKVWDHTYVEEFLIRASKESKAKFKEDLEDELRGLFQLYSNGMEKGLALLSGVGNLSPIVGFLGTVIGMISAFASIAAATTVNAKVVAVGIQMALVTTAGGLLVAAPTLAFYYFFAHTIHSRFATAENIIAVECDNLPRLSSALNNAEEKKNNE
jgi:biopolymer transport protein ExbB